MTKAHMLTLGIRNAIVSIFISLAAFYSQAGACPGECVFKSRTGISSLFVRCPFTSNFFMSYLPLFLVIFSLFSVNVS